MKCRCTDCENYVLSRWKRQCSFAMLNHRRQAKYITYHEFL